MDLNLKIVIKLDIHVFSGLKEPVGRLLSLLLCVNVFFELLSLINEWSDLLKESILNAKVAKPIILLLQDLTDGSKLLVVLWVKDGK
jgi:hypothetical protein